MADEENSGQPALPPLDELCSTCKGTGEYSGRRCYQCEGNRRVPTEAGRMIMDFIGRHLRIRITWEAEDEGR